MQSYEVKNNGREQKMTNGTGYSIKKITLRCFVTGLIWEICLRNGKTLMICTLECYINSSA